MSNAKELCISRAVYIEKPLTTFAAMYICSTWETEVRDSQKLKFATAHSQRERERWGSCMSQLRLVFASAMRNDATSAVPSILMRYISPCVPLLNGSDDGFNPFKKTEASAVWHVL